ncbi:putative bZip transcription factor [Metarhizium acridum CQMa 102]|uniref:Putative bZip transcription factor n=1 Tax=Metarhizium acridum (strain CQMa 102) TaxID=655827 RepID=E9E1Y9_METAQ|nr:putative bZip transcription factor [Metarhizium acridum CQMa 102]EFY90086.1 putative bZip transcription factor [Metarhizium acridum CQMa 102]
MGTSPGTESKSPKLSNNKTLRQGEPRRIVPSQASEFRPFLHSYHCHAIYRSVIRYCIVCFSTCRHFRLSRSPPPLLELQSTVQVRYPTTRRRSHRCSHAFLIVDTASDSKIDPAAVKPDGASNAETAKPLAPPPRPGQQPQGNNTPDYFSGQVGGSLSLEPNPFEQSFGGGGGPETPGGTKLPSVAALTSPSSLLPVGNNTPFNWGGGSLRTGPLSPAMLSGPANDYFSDAHHLRGGFPTPNESSLRSGLTPGGSGSMFPAPSPNSQALFAQLASGGATPSTIDFHRTAMSAAAAKREQGQPQTQSQQVTSQPADMPNGATPTVKAEPKQASGPFDPHDNDAANGLFMLAQGAQTRNGNQSSQFSTSSAPSHAHPAPAPAQNSNTSPQMSTGNAASRGASEGTNGSEEAEQTKPAAKGKGKKATAASNGRRKADDTPAKAPPNKKSKGNAGAANGMSPEVSDEEEDDMGDDPSSKTKMTDEEKRKNFLERNR